MSERWQVVSTSLPARPWVPIGPGLDELPATFEVQAKRADLPGLLLQLRLRFDGVRIAIHELLMGSTDEAVPIKPSDVVGLRVAEAVRVGAIDAASEWGRHSISGVLVGSRAGQKSTAEELRLVAAVYAFEFATWGEPRNAVMGAWGLPRSTANGWIRRAAEQWGGLPGVGVNAPPVRDVQLGAESVQLAFPELKEPVSGYVAQGSGSEGDLDTFRVRPRSLKELDRFLADLPKDVGLDFDLDHLPRRHQPKAKQRVMDAVAKARGSGSIDTGNSGAEVGTTDIETPDDSR